MQRTFILGDEWCYFKLYAGFKTADTLLINSIFPLAQSLKNAEVIDSWFFIRYADPKFHLRIRFHVNEVNKIPMVIMAFNECIRSFVTDEFIWKVQTDTYNRELERYGEGETMILSEQLFEHDSEMICKVISLKWLREDENLRWLLSLKMIDSLLDEFDLNLNEKYELLNSLQDNFGKEYRINNDYRRQFGKKYRIEKARIEEILHPDASKSDKLLPLITPILDKAKQAGKLIRNIKMSVQANDQLLLNNLISSYIHMTMNRLFRTQQRTHELIVYDYLFRYYSSQIARNKKSITADTVN